jgi:hypothetical protein
MESDIIVASHISMCREVRQVEREFDRRIAVAMIQSIDEETPRIEVLLA